MRKELWELFLTYAFVNTSLRCIIPMLLPVVRCESRSSPAMAEQVTAVAYTAGRPEGLGSLQVRDRSVQVE